MSGNSERKAHRYFLRSVDLLDSSSESESEKSQNSVHENKFSPNSTIPSRKDSLEESTANISNLINSVIDELLDGSNLPKNNTDYQIKVDQSLAKTQEIITNNNQSDSNIETNLTSEVTSNLNKNEISLDPKSNQSNESNISGGSTNLITMGDKELNYKHALLSIPKFDGNPESLGQFIRCCELITIDLKKEEIQKFLCLMNTLLVGKANDVIKYNVYDSWDDLKLELESRFSCPKSVQQIQSELSLIKQLQSEGIQEFANKIEILLSQLNSACVKSEGEDSAKLLRNFNSKLALSSFTNGLYIESIKLFVKSGRFKSFRDAVREALEEESLVKSNSSQNSRPKNVVSPNKCQLCGLFGHIGNSCRRFNVTAIPSNPVTYQNSSYPNPSTSQNRVYQNQNHDTRPNYNQNASVNHSNRPIICAYCKYPGHVIANCRKREFNNNRNLQATNIPANNVNIVSNSNSENSYQLEMPTSATVRVQDLQGTQE